MKKTKSLSHLLSILVTKFFPDAYYKYLRLNVAALDLYKGYSNIVPQFLHNRPKQMVEHCMKRWLEAEDMDASTIDTVDDQTFLVKSQSDVNSFYSVTFNNMHSGMPSCSCLDWQSSHLPCKHFMLIFKSIEGFDWEKLPDTYRNNSYITLDIDCCSTFPSEIDVLQCEENEQPESVLRSEITQLDLPLPASAELKRERSKISGLCQILKDLVHHSSDLASMRYVSEHLTTTVALIRSGVPQCGTFVEETNVCTNKKKINRTKVKGKGKSIKKQRKLLKLPVQKSKQKGSGRHGYRAQQMKYFYTKKGIHELSSDAEYSQRKTGRNVTFKKPLEEVPLKSFENIRPETTNVTNTNNIYNVNGYKINQQSFDDLDSDLPDEVTLFPSWSIRNKTTCKIFFTRESLVMNAFISVKVGNCKGKSVGFVSSSTMTSIFFDPIDINEPFPPHGYLNEINFEQYEMLIGAVCENSNHWCLMAIFLQKRQLLYMDPLGEHAVKKNQYLQAWILFLNERYNRGIGSLPNMEWEILTKSHRKQLDSISCGVFTLKFTELLLDGCENFNFDTTKRGLRAQRHVIGQYLVEHSDEFKSYRNREPSLILNEDEVAVTDSEEVVESIIISTAGDTSDINIEDGLKYPDNQTTGLLNYNLRNNPPKKRRMSSFIYPDIPQKMKKKSIPYEFCLSKIPVMFDRLKVMMRCSDENCDAIDHGRHHEFVRNPEAVYERERTTHCFGNDFFGQKIYEEIHMLLDKEFICLTRDKRHPYTGGIKRKIKNLPDCPLQNVFETHGLLAHTYIQCVCVKEIFVWIVCEYKKCPYEFADEQCQLTEVSVRNMVKGIKMKNKLNEN